MKAAVWYSNRDIRIEELPRPRPGRGEMLVKVHSCGICGSDVVEWYRLPRAPLVQGHEIGGEVVEIGEGVTRFVPGDRVFVAPKVPCMECRTCRDGRYPACTAARERLGGGFAQYVLVPEPIVGRGTRLLPDTIDYDRSTFIEPVACVVRAQRLAGLRAGRVLAVLGCGMSGIVHIRLAKALGCKVAAVDVNAARLGMARVSGADLALMATEDVQSILGDTFGQKADVVMLCTAAVSAIDQGFDCLEPGGDFVFFAVPGPDKAVTMPVNRLWTREVRILTSYYCGPPDIQEALVLIDSGTIKVDDLVTHRLPLKDTARGFSLVASGTESLKVIIRPNE